MKAVSIAVVAFDRMSPFHLAVPCAVFGTVRGAAPQYSLNVCAVEPGPLQTTAGFGIAVEHGLGVLKSADTIIVPSWRDPAERPPAALLRALAKAHQRGAQIVGLCLGAYVLAEAGLLDGRRATTHWAYADDFVARFPQVTVDADVLYIEDGSVFTSAGTAAGIDCCLHLVRQRYGNAAANSVARNLVMPPHRQGGQAQFIEHPIPVTARDNRLSGLLDWARAQLQLPHTLDSLAERALMSRRTFTRHFRQLTGTTVGAWLIAERLSFTQHLLESSEHSVEAIAALAGFGSPVSLRHHFHKTFRVSPSSWRSTFKGQQAAAGA
jgi:transcriptional regulator GlxA family with amidase domain